MVQSISNRTRAAKIRKVIQLVVKNFSSQNRDIQKTIYLFTVKRSRKETVN